VIRAWGEGSVRQRRGRWYVRFGDGQGGRRELVTSAKSKQEALAILRTRLERSRGVRAIGAAPVSTLYDRMCDEYEAGGRDVRDIAKAWKHLGPVFGAQRIERVTSDALHAYVAHRREEGAAPATIRLELARLRRMFRLGVQLTPRLVAEVPAFPTVRVDNVRESFFDAAHLEKLCTELPVHLRPLAIVAYWLGWRRGELLALRWSHIDLETGRITIAPGKTKNREGRIAYLPEPALDELRRWRAETSRVEREQERIIPHVFHRGGEPISWYDRDWRAACDRAGLPGRRMHDFRRSAARNYIDAGLSEGVAMKVLGHKTPSIFRRYQIVAEQDLADAARRVALNQQPMTSPAPLRIVPPRRRAARTK
jgi:integrase